MISRAYMIRRERVKEMKHEDYTVKWICALPTELAAAVVMLNERHNSLPQDFHDINNYRLGRIDRQNVIIACLSFEVTSNTSAVIVTSHIRSIFSSIIFDLMIDVGGEASSVENDIRLGDVVISKPAETSDEVIQYDFEKIVQEGRFVRTGSLNRSPDMLLNAVSSLYTRHMIKKTELSRHLLQMLSKYPKLQKTSAYQGAQ